jgi:SAM-dependent methyltransferase
MLTDRFVDSLRRDGVAGALHKVRRFVRNRIPFGSFTSNKGYCPCCRRDTTFVSKSAWLRDDYRCVKCFSIPRQRHLQHVLDMHVPGWEAMKIHESSPSNRFIAMHAADYSSSQFLEGVNTGSTANGVRCENLECLTFPDETFDLFVTQDVFEHVFDPKAAAREIARVLRPGGGAGGARLHRAEARERREELPAGEAGTRQGRPPSRRAIPRQSGRRREITRDVGLRGRFRIAAVGLDGLPGDDLQDSRSTVRNRRRVSGGIRREKPRSRLRHCKRARRAAVAMIAHD